MNYQVSGKLNIELAGELLAKLNDGSIRAQQPDGEEIYKGLQAAVVKKDWVLMNMICFCSTPLEHERETVLDRHFNHLDIQAQPMRQKHQGEPFLSYLESRLASN